MRRQARTTSPRSCRRRNRARSTSSSPSWRCCGSARGLPPRVADPAQPHPVPVRSTGASEAIGRLAPVVSALAQSGFVVDCTLEGLMHAPETPDILKAGARILAISNEHPEALERMRAGCRAGDARARGGEDAARRRSAWRSPRPPAPLDVDMAGASTVGIWGWTDKPGTLAHWPGGLVVSFPKAGSRQRHAGARPRRRQPHLQALPRGPDQAHPGTGLRDARSRATAPTPR